MTATTARNSFRFLVILTIFDSPFLTTNNLHESSKICYGETWKNHSLRLRVLSLHFTVTENIYFIRIITNADIYDFVNFGKTNIFKTQTSRCLLQQKEYQSLSGYQLTAILQVSKTINNRLIDVSFEVHCVRYNQIN